MHGVFNEGGQLISMTFGVGNDEDAEAAALPSPQGLGSSQGCYDEGNLES